MKKRNKSLNIVLKFGIYGAFCAGILLNCNMAPNINEVHATSGDDSNITLFSTTSYYVKDEDELKNALIAGGNIVLVNDISCEKTLNVGETVSLDLNGNTLSMDESLLDGGNTSGITVSSELTVQGSGTISTGIRVANNASLILKNGTISSYGVIVASGGTFTMNGGNISDCNSAGVVVSGLSSFTMNDGVIQKNHGDAGVYLKNDNNGPEFNLKDGTITGNDGTGVYLEANTFFGMTGGTISNNNIGIYADYSLGLSSTVELSNNINMHGGTIKENKSDGVMVGGGFFMDGGSIHSNSGNGVSFVGSDAAVDDRRPVFEFSEGTIKNNKKSGIKVGNGSVGIEGGTIQGNEASGIYIDALECGISFSGAPVVSENTNGGIRSNIRWKEIKSTNGNSEFYQIITLDGKLTDGCKLGISPGNNRITVDNNDDFTSHYSTYNGATDPNQFFFSDDEDYTISLNTSTGEAQLNNTKISTYLRNSSTLYVRENNRKNELEGNYTEFFYKEQYADKITSGGKTYNLVSLDGTAGSGQKGSPRAFELYNDIKGVFESPDGEKITVTYDGVERISRTTPGNIDLKIKSDDVSFKNDTITAQVFQWKYDEATISAGQRYTYKVGTGHGYDLYFTPSTSGKYSFSATTGQGRVGFKIANVDNYTDVSSLENKTYGLTDSKITQEFQLEANHKYRFEITAEQKHKNADSWNELVDNEEVSVFIEQTSAARKFTIGRDNNSFVHNMGAFFSGSEPKTYKIYGNTYREALIKGETDQGRLKKLITDMKEENEIKEYINNKPIYVWGGSCYGLTASMMYSYYSAFLLDKYDVGVTTPV